MTPKNNNGSVVLAASAPESYKLVRFSTEAKGGRFSFYADMLATVPGKRHGEIEVFKVLSACGPQTSIKALRAMLVSPNVSATIVFDNSPLLADAGFRQYGNVLVARDVENGYRTYAHRIAADWYQLLAIAKDDRLLPHVTEAGVWKILRSARYTTPVLRHWTPRIIERLREKSSDGDPYLVPLNCFQCEAAMLYVLDKELDAIVQEEVINKKLSFTR